MVGSAVASALGYRFYDTGAMYRAVTWAALRRGVDPSDAAALTALVALAVIEVFEGAPGESDRTRVLVDADDATPHLRDDGVERNVSLVSRVPEVRAALVRIQRELAAAGGLVMAGRDIGTVVLPHADLKVYLDASPRVRAERRAEQLRAAGAAVDLAALTAEMVRRDGIDSTRATSPLTAGSDAMIINTDRMAIAEVVARIIELAS